MEDERAKDAPNNRQAQDCAITNEMADLSLTDWGYIAMSDMIFSEEKAAQILGEYFKMIENE